MQATIIGRKSCSWCRKARQLCRKNDVPFTYKDLDHPDNAPLRQWFRVENIKTVPQVFLIENGTSTLVGGYDDLQAYFKKEGMEWK